MQRRVLAAVLPDVALVLARRRLPPALGAASSAPHGPLAVVVDPESAIVAAADTVARREGVKVGQGAAAATVRASGLCIVHVARDEIVREVELVLEVLAAFGPTVAHRLEHEVGDEAPLDSTYYEDTAWVDVTGATELAGGEKTLVDTARARIEAVGHHARIALASGPRIARSLARLSAHETVIASSRDRERHLFSALPIHALPVSARAHTFFRRVGLVTVGDLVALPRAQVAARLGADRDARVVLDLLELRDDTPLAAWTPARVVAESQAFEDGVEGSEALAFVLRGMTSRLGQRLSARGEAAGKLVLSLGLDRSIVRHARGEGAPTSVEISVALPVPLADPEALLRTLMPPLERTELVAPVLVLRLVAEDVARARRDQLDLSRGRGIDPNRLKHLAAELAAELGEGRAGFFRILDAHRPEARSRIELDGGAVRAALSREEGARESDAGDALVPTRLLPEPAPIEPFVVGARLVVHGRAHRVERVVPLARLEGVEWWIAPVTRDYVRVSLVAEQGGERSEALVFHDRIARASFLHGWME